MNLGITISQEDLDAISSETRGSIEGLSQQANGNYDNYRQHCNDIWCSVIAKDFNSGTLLAAIQQLVKDTDDFIESYNGAMRSVVSNYVGITGNEIHWKDVDKTTSNPSPIGDTKDQLPDGRVGLMVDQVDELKQAYTKIVEDWKEEIRKIADIPGRHNAYSALENESLKSALDKVYNNADKLLSEMDEQFKKVIANETDTYRTTQKSNQDIMS